MDTSTHGSGEYDLVVLKYSSNGDQQWVQRFPTGSTSLEAAAEMAVSEDGEACVAGSCADEEGHPCAVTLRYSPSGNLLWSQRYSGAEGIAAGANAVTIDRFDNVIVAGYELFAPSDRDPEPRRAYLVLDYDRSGHLTWSRAYPWRGYGFQESPVRMVTDGYNNVCIAGFIYGESSSSGCGTLRLTSDGAVAWADP